MEYNIKTKSANSIKINFFKWNYLLIFYPFRILINQRVLYYFYSIDVSVILAETVPRRLNSKIVVLVEDFVEISPLCFPSPDRFPLFSKRNSSRGEHESLKSCSQLSCIKFRGVLTIWRLIRTQSDIDNGSFFSS